MFVFFPIHVLPLYNEHLANSMQILKRLFYHRTAQLVFLMIQRSKRVATALSASSKIFHPTNEALPSLHTQMFTHIWNLTTARLLALCLDACCVAIPVTSISFLAFPYAQIYKETGQNPPKWSPHPSQFGCTSKHRIDTEITRPRSWAATDTHGPATPSLSAAPGTAAHQGLPLRLTEEAATQRLFISYSKGKGTRICASPSEDSASPSGNKPPQMKLYPLNSRWRRNTLAWTRPLASCG